MSEKEVDDSLVKIAEEVKSICDHGVVFDEEAARKLLEEAPAQNTGDPALDFIMGSTATAAIRKLWPRLNGPCPKGCGYNGIAYASYAHYLYGDY
jgi:hypothetical protein